MGDETKIAYIREKLAADTGSADIKMSLMSAALSSYKHDSVLKPFPPMFANDDFKDYPKLERTLTKCPSLDRLLRYLDACHEKGIAPQIDSTLVDLLQWTIQPKHFQIKSCNKEKYSIIQELTGQILSVPAPSHIFEVVYNEDVEERFRERRAGRNVLYAYHGSRAENFHSILHHGLQGHMSKNALFGEGIYLSCELSVSMPYAPSGVGWEKSLLGDRLSCFAVCEVIDDEQYVKCSEKDVPSDGQKPLSRTSSRARIAGSEGGDIPEKYFVVRNNDVIRVKYILVYAENTRSKSAIKTWQLWAKEHKFVLSLIFYGVVLLAVGLYNSPSFHYYVRRFMKQR